MRFEHPAHPGRAVRLGYCLNAHPAEDLGGVRDGIAQLALPLAARLGGGDALGVGLYLPARAAFELTRPGAAQTLLRLAGELADGGLDGFTFNAFPFGGFHRPGLKRGVFAPTWAEPERLDFTLAVATVAEAVARAAAERGFGPGPAGHVSISTHCGGFGPPGRRGAVRGFARAAGALAELEEESGLRIVLAAEPEPRSSANDTREWADLAADWLREGPEFLEQAHGLDPELAAAVLRRHLGLCLDACHAAVEFEPPGEALGRARSQGFGLGKLQFAHALELRSPAHAAAGRAALLAMDEPVYLHQTTAQCADGGLLRAEDLSELAARLDGPEAPAWLAAECWRTHYHVPVDLTPDRAAGLACTARHAEALLTAALADPAAWGLAELHLEVETYTWSVLPGDVRGPGQVLDGLERELRHVRALLEREGWHRISQTPGSHR